VRKVLLLSLPLAALVGISLPLVLLAGRGPRAEAQGVPPSPPATFYGTVSGVPDGTTVVALVVSSSGSVTCGTGTVRLDGSQTVYAVDVFHESQKAGCGAAGRTVRFYFPSTTPGGGGRLATQSGTWSGPGPVQLNLTAGAQLTNTTVVPALAKSQ
jgi:hypothetical protein